MMELLNSLTAEAVIAILGSLVTITVGALALTKAIRGSKPADTNPVPSTTNEEIDQIHARISAAKDVATENKGELRVVANQLEALSKRMEEHERRDIADFKVMQQKIDKVMDIVIQILQDDKL